MPLTAGLPPALAFLRPAVQFARRVLRQVVRVVQRPLGRLIAATGRLWLPTGVLIPLAHESTDTATLELIVDRASQRRGRRAAALLEVALQRRARLALDAREDRDALGWFERVHATVGPNANTWTWLAVTLRRLGRLDESRHAGEQALAHDADWCPALAHLGILHQQLGDRRASVDCWRRLLAAPDASPDQLRWAWIGLVRAREFELGLDAATLLRARTGDEPRARAIEAVTLHELGRDTDALALVDDLRRGDTDDHVRAVAFFHGRTGESDAAFEHLERLPVARRGREAMLELVAALREDGHLRLALRAAEAAAAQWPDDAEIRQARDLVAGVVRVFTGEADLGAGTRVDRGAPVAGRILHVVGRTVPYASSGYAVRTDHTVRAQRELGIDAQVVSQLGFPWEDGRAAPAVEDVGGVPHHRLPFGDDARLPLPFDERQRRNIDALSDLVEQLRPAALHAASDFRNGLLAVTVAERFHLPVVYEMRGFWEETWLARHGEHAMDRDVYQWRRERELEVARRASHVVTLAPTMRDALIERGLDREVISLAPNAVDPDGFPEGPRDDRLAAELELGDEVVVGYVSSFVGYEGIHVLIAAISRLRADGLDVRGLLVGDGVVRPELERQARESGVDDLVTFTGRVPHERIADYYRLIDIFVVPRTNVRVCRLVSPLKPYEAMATGRAMVVSATPVLCDIVEDGVTGRTFVPENPDDLAHRIAELARDPAERVRLGAAARTRVLAEHTWIRNAERYRDVYRRIGAM